MPASMTSIDDTERIKIDEIKAKTMYDMVDYIDDGKRQVLYLSAEQAKLIASSKPGLEKMLMTLELFPRADDSPKPKLVLNLLKSLGLSNQFNDWKIGPAGQWRVAEEKPGKDRRRSRRMIWLLRRPLLEEHASSTTTRGPLSSTPKTQSPRG